MVKQIEVLIKYSDKAGEIEAVWERGEVIALTVMKEKKKKKKIGNRKNKENKVGNQ